MKSKSRKVEQILQKLEKKTIDKRKIRAVRVKTFQ